MNHILMVLLCTLLTPTIGLAKQVGLLKVQIHKINHQHNSKVNLIINDNNNPALKFAHSAINNDELKTTIDDSVLAKGQLTPLKANYSNLQPGCKFVFSVFFSYSGNIWIKIGDFSAPTTNTNTYLPIGICDNGNVCSSDKRIQADLDRQDQETKANDAKNVQALRDWLQAAIQRENQLNNELIEIAENTSKTIDTTNTLDAQADQMLAIESEEFQTTQEQTAPSSFDSEEQGLNLTDISRETAKLANLGLPADLRQAIEKNNISPELFLSFGWVYAAAMSIEVAYMGRLSPEQTELLKKVSEHERANFFTSYQAGVKETIRTIAYTEKLAGLAGIGLRMSPLGDAIDFCETFTGKTNCMPDGDTLSTGDRLLAATGILIGNRHLNGLISSAVEKELRTAVKEIDTVLDESGKIKWSNLFAEVESGELIKQNKTELIEQLRKDKNIPNEWKAELTNKREDGISFNRANSEKADEVRIMSGNPQHPFPNSRVSYVKYKKNGQWLDKFGNVLASDKNIEAHIPLDDFNYRD